MTYHGKNTRLGIDRPPRCLGSNRSLYELSTQGPLCDQHDSDQRKRLDPTGRKYACRPSLLNEKRIETTTQANRPAGEHAAPNHGLSPLNAAAFPAVEGE